MKEMLSAVSFYKQFGKGVVEFIIFFFAKIKFALHVIILFRSYNCCSGITVLVNTSAPLPDAITLS